MRPDRQLCRSQSDILTQCSKRISMQPTEALVWVSLTFLDVLDAQRTLYQAKSQYINALLEAHQSIAEIERALGEVVDHSNNEALRIIYHDIFNIDKSSKKTRTNDCNYLWSSLLALY